MTKFKQILSKIMMVAFVCSTTTVFSVHAGQEQRDFVGRNARYAGIIATGAVLGGTHLIARKATFLGTPGRGRAAGWTLCVGACMIPSVATYKLLSTKFKHNNDLGAAAAWATGYTVGVPLSAAAGVPMYYSMRMALQALKKIK
jgi:hypothetical protein